jgi:hypothetical protein
MVRVLELAGFARFEFFSQVNGFFNVADAGDRRRLQQEIRSAENWNIVIASRTTDHFVANDRQAALAGNGFTGAADSSSVLTVEGTEWRGRDLLKENLRYLKRRFGGIMERRRRSSRTRRVNEITRVYAEVLGREPDESGLTHYVEELERGRSLEDVRRSLMASDEYLARRPSKK